MKKNKNTKKGFSLAEAVISVFVVAIGLVATINLMVNGINHSTDSRDHIIASQLAQEGLELVRNVRDNNWANSIESFASPFPSASSDDCRIDKDYDYSAGGDIECGAGKSKQLYFDGNFYVHATKVATKFQRKIELNFDDPPSADNLIVTSIVIWGGSFPALADCNVNNKCVYTQSVLTKWGE